MSITSIKVIAVVAVLVCAVIYIGIKLTATEVVNLYSEEVTPDVVNISKKISLEKKLEGHTDNVSANTNKTVEESISQSAQQHVDNIYEELSNNPNYPTLESRVDAMNTRRPHKRVSAEDVLDALAKTSTWSSTGKPADHLPLTTDEIYDGREFIQFDSDRVEYLLPGDLLEVPIAQLGVTYVMRIDRQETNSNGSTTWYGHLEDFNESYKVVVTVGDALSLAGIDTPQGHYELQANNEDGWIVSSSTAFKNNFDQPDFIIPPKDEIDSSKQVVIDDI